MGIRFIEIRIIGSKRCRVRAKKSLNKDDRAKIRRWIIDFLKRHNGKVSITTKSLYKSCIMSVGFYFTPMNLFWILKRMEKEGIIKIERVSHHRRRLILRKPAEKGSRPD